MMHACHVTLGDRGKCFWGPSLAPVPHFESPLLRRMIKCVCVGEEGELMTRLWQGHKDDFVLTRQTPQTWRIPWTANECVQLMCRQTAYSRCLFDWLQATYCRAEACEHAQTQTASRSHMIHTTLTDEFLIMKWHIVFKQLSCLYKHWTLGQKFK